MLEEVASCGRIFFVLKSLAIPAAFNDEAYFSNVTFIGEAYFSGAIFNG